MRFKNTGLILISVLLLPLASSHAQTFTKITEGAIVNDGADSWGCSWGDFDNDGFLDLFVDNINTEIPVNNFLYRNNGPDRSGFTKITESVLVNIISGSNSSSWGDFDNDGDLDLFVLHRGAGFGPDPDNSLYVNNGNKTFNKITFVDSVTGSISCSWGDFNNDGYLDLFIATAANTNNILFQNIGDGTFTKITRGVIVNEKIRSRGCSWGDFDNDGNLDLLVVNRSGNNLLFRNDGEGSFVKITEDPVVNDSSLSYSGSWGDFDNDGDLDVFVTVIDNDNLLYKNNGNGIFTKITKAVIVNDGGVSFGSSWGDFDNDGDLDLFVANNGENNSLYTNNGDGTFTKITEGTIVNDGGTSAGCSWADYDNDGDLDLFVANFNGENNFLYSNNGNRNHWINIKCLGTISNRSAIGVRVKVKAFIRGKSVWQMREISGQTGFGAQNSLNAEFGLGDATEIDSVIIEWPASGIVDVLTKVAVNQFLKVIEGQGITSVTVDDPVPKGFDLQQNYPNPFNPTTTILYAIPQSGNVTLTIYDLLGREVKVLVNGYQTAGSYSTIFHATDVASGVYFYQLALEGQKQTKKMLLIH